MRDKKEASVHTGGKKNSQGEDIHLGDAVYYELFSFSERQQQLQGSSGSCGEKINTSHETDLPTQLMKLWHSKNKNTQAWPEGQIFFQ